MVNSDDNDDETPITNMMNMEMMKREYPGRYSGLSEVMVRPSTKPVKLKVERSMRLLTTPREELMTSSRLHKSTEEREELDG